MVATAIQSARDLELRGVAPPKKLISLDDDAATDTSASSDKLRFSDGPEDTSSNADEDEATELKTLASKSSRTLEMLQNQHSDEKVDEEIPVMPSAEGHEDNMDTPREWIDIADATPRQPSVNLSLRRSTTVAVATLAAHKAFLLRKHSDSDDHTDDDVLGSPIPLTRSKSAPERAAAMEAIQGRSTMFRYAVASRTLRESVRQMYSFMHNEFPKDCDQQADAEVKLGPVWRDMHVAVTREGVMCNRISLVRKKKKQIRISNDDILGAARVKETTEVTIHYMKQGRGQNSDKLMRRYRQLHMRFGDALQADKYVQAVQLLVKWDARVPMNKTRKIKVVVNPHSGKRQGLHIWETWKPIFELAGIQCDMETTQYSGHARDIGRSFDLGAKYEAIVFVGGDGTVNEFMNGVFAREEDEWRNLVATTPVSLLCAGTDNAFGLGVGIPTHEAAVYCVVKRKIRPLDVLTCQTEDPDGTIRREFSCCGVSYGIGADIAVESESTRWLGVHRYKYLKLKRGVFAPRPHEATIKYVLSDTVETDPVTGDQHLQTYFEAADKDAQNQHHIELCSVYDDFHLNKRWDGDANSIFNPASEDRFADQWKSESGAYTTVGASNVYFETKYYHPSDGNMDLIIARKGNLAKSLEVGYKYIAGDYLQSSLVDYFKVKAMVIDQVVPDPINVDGEVFEGPGPFRIEVVPRLLCVLSEM